MVLGILLALSAVIAAVIAGFTGAFSCLAWLWVLPVSFVASFLVIILLAFLLLVVACAFVDPDKPREEDNRFFRLLVKIYPGLILSVLPIKVHTRGLENIPKSGRFLLVSNHLHEADVVVLLHYFRKSQLAFISKRENRDMFLVGKIMSQILCQLVNRENDREALKTILKCIQLIKEDKCSVSVFPEGYIHNDRKFQPFRPGVFKIAQKAKVPIVVCTLQGTEHVVKNTLRLKPSEVQLHLLEVLPADFWEGKTTVQVSDYIHDLMAKDLDPSYLMEENP